jgi:hypothetical protein
MPFQCILLNGTASGANAQQRSQGGLLNAFAANYPLSAPELHRFSVSPADANYFDPRLDGHPKKPAVKFLAEQRRIAASDFSPAFQGRESKTKKISRRVATIDSTRAQSSLRDEKQINDSFTRP